MTPVPTTSVPRPAFPPAAPAAWPSTLPDCGAVLDPFGAELRAMQPLPDHIATAVAGRGWAWRALAAHPALTVRTRRRLLDGWGHLARHIGKAALKRRDGGVCLVVGAREALHTLIEHGHVHWNDPVCRPELERWLGIAAVPRRPRNRNDNYTRWTTAHLLLRTPGLPIGALLALANTSHRDDEHDRGRWRLILSYPDCPAEVAHHASRVTAPSMASFEPITTVLAGWAPERLPMRVRDWLRGHMPALDCDALAGMAECDPAAEVRLHALRRLLSRMDDDWLGAAARVILRHGEGVARHLAAEELAPLLLSREPLMREAGAFAVAWVRGPAAPGVGARCT